jgi:flagellar motor switch protein FliN/FliY
VGEPIDVVVNGRVIARGEVVVVDEATSRFGIKLTEVVGPSESDKAT